MAGGRPRRRAAQRDKACKTWLCQDATPTPKGGVRGEAHRPAPTLPVDPEAEAEALQAIETLYDDLLRPYGRIIRKRLAERRVKAGPLATARLEPHGKDLRALCERSSKLRVVPERGGEWVALLLNREESFVDIYSEEDCYPPEMWQAAEVYFESMVDSCRTTGGTSASGALHGGRYASARELLQRKPHFLRGRSFGEVCHIMELAISQKSLLGYCNGAVVPYSQSTSMKKSLCAGKQQPCSGLASGGDVLKARVAGDYEVVDWEQARVCLRQILDEAVAAGHSQVPLSNVKRIFRSKFHLELSETTLGHAKISTLLLDAKFRDICTVKLQDHGYAVLPVSGAGALPAPLLLESRLVTPSERLVTKVASGRTALENSPSSALYSSPASGRTGFDSTTSSARWAAMSPSFLTPEGGLVKATFIHADLPPPTPTGPSAARRSLSMPKNHGSDRDALEAAYISLRRVDSPTSAQPQVFSVEAPAGVPPATQQLSAQGTCLAARVRPPMALDDDLFGSDDLAPIGGHSRNEPAELEPDGALDGTPEFVHFTPSNSMFVPKTPLWEEGYGGYAFDDVGLGVQVGGFFANFPKRTPSPKGYTSPKGETFIDVGLGHHQFGGSFANFPMRTPSPTWATHKCLPGRSSGSPMGFSQSFPTQLSLEALTSNTLPGGASFAYFSP